MMDIHITDKGMDFVNKVARYLYEKTGVTHHINKSISPPGKWPYGAFKSHNY